ncbi:hypothetical protein [Lachnoclostridium sp.]|nr:hypothetical protein [Lachnoclostridium sp.]
MMKPSNCHAVVGFAGRSAKEYKRAMDKGTRNGKSYVIYGQKWNFMR